MFKLHIGFTYTPNSCSCLIILWLITCFLSAACHTCCTNPWHLHAGITHIRQGTAPRSRREVWTEEQCVNTSILRTDSKYPVYQQSCVKKSTLRVSIKSNLIKHSRDRRVRKCIIWQESHKSRDGARFTLGASLPGTYSEFPRTRRLTPGRESRGTGHSHICTHLVPVSQFAGRIEH